MDKQIKQFEVWYESHNDNFDGMFYKSDDHSGQHTYDKVEIEEAFRFFSAGYDSVETPTPNSSEAIKAMIVLLRDRANKETTNDTISGELRYRYEGQVQALDEVIHNLSVMEITTDRETPTPSSDDAPTTCKCGNANAMDKISSSLYAFLGHTKTQAQLIRDIHEVIRTDYTDAPTPSSTEAIKALDKINILAINHFYDDDVDETISDILKIIAVNKEGGA